MAKSDNWKQTVAADQLDRVLSFFSRVESKASALFAVDTGMLGLLALNARMGDFSIWYVASLYVVAATLISTTLVFLYRATFPQLKGGASSLIYFREIGATTEAKYIDAMRACDEDRYTDELLGQVWRNSEILTQKFDALKSAFFWTAIAVLPWFGALLAAALNHAALTVN